MRIPLTPIDESFFVLDSPTTSQSIASLCFLEGIPDREALEQRWSALVEFFPKLRFVLEAERGLFGEKHYWNAQGSVTLAHHLLYRSIPLDKNSSRNGRAAFFNAASEEFEKPLDRTRPLWKQVILDNGKESALLTVFHHGLGDGLSLLEVIHALSSEKAPNPERQKETALAHNLPRYPWTQETTRAIVREVRATKGPPSLCGNNSAIRVLSGISLPNSIVRKLKTYFGVSQNDLYLALITRSIALALSRSTERTLRPRAIVPVSLRTRHERFAIGNQLTGVGVALPIDLDSPAEILTFLKNESTEWKRQNLGAGYASLGFFGTMLPGGLRQRYCNYLATKTAFIATNLPESPTQRSIAGCTISAHFGYPALMKSHGLGFGCITYRGQAHLSVVSDPAIIPDSSNLSAGLEAALYELLQITESADKRERTQNT